MKLGIRAKLFLISLGLISLSVLVAYVYARPQIERDATMRTIFDQLLLWIGPGALTRARADYDFAAAGTAEAPILSLTPRAQSPIAKAFKRIDLRLDPKTWLLRSILLIEVSGDEKEITFSRLERIK